MLRGRLRLFGAYGYVTNNAGHLSGRLMSLAARGVARDGAEVEFVVNDHNTTVHDTTCLKNKFDEGVPRFDFDQFMNAPSVSVLRVLRQSRYATVEVGLALRNFKHYRQGSAPRNIELSANNEIRFIVSFDDPHTDPSLIAQLRNAFNGNEYQARVAAAWRFEVSPIDNLAHGGTFDSPGFHSATRLTRIDPPKSDGDLLQRSVDAAKRSLADVFPSCDPWPAFNLQCCAEVRSFAWDLRALRWLAVDSSKDCMAEGAFSLVPNGEQKKLLLCVSCPLPYLVGNEGLTGAIVNCKQAVYLTSALGCDGVMSMVPPELIERCQLNSTHADLPVDETLVLVFTINLQNSADSEEPYLAIIDRKNVETLSMRQFESDPRISEVAEFADALVQSRQGNERGLLSMSALQNRVEIHFSKLGLPERLVEVKDNRAREVIEEFTIAVSRITANVLRRNGMDMLLTSQAAPERTALDNFAKRVLRQDQLSVTGFVALNRTLHAKPPGTLTEEDVIQAEWMSKMLNPAHTSLFCNRDFLTNPVGHFTHGLDLSAPASRPLRSVRDLFNQGQLLRVIAGGNDVDPTIELRSAAIPEILAASEMAEPGAFVLVPSSVPRDVSAPQASRKLVDALVPKAIDVIPRPDFVTDINHLASACKQIDRAVKGVAFSIALSKHGFLTRAIVQSVTADSFSLVDFRTHFECKITFESIGHLLHSSLVDEAAGIVELHFRCGNQQDGCIRLAANRSLLPLVIGAVATNGTYNLTPHCICLDEGRRLWLPLAQTQAHAASLFHHRPLTLPPLEHSFLTTRPWAQQFAYGELEELVQTAVTGGISSADPSRRKIKGPEWLDTGYFRLAEAEFRGQRDRNGVRPQLEVPCLDRDFAEKLKHGCVAIIFAPVRTSVPLPRRLGGGSVWVDSVMDAYLLPTSAEVSPLASTDETKASVVLNLPSFRSLSRSAQNALPELCRSCSGQRRVLIYSVAELELAAVRFLHTFTQEAQGGQPEAELGVAKAFPELFQAQAQRPIARTMGADPMASLRQRFGRELPRPVLEMLNKHLAPKCPTKNTATKKAVALDEVQRVALDNMFREPLAVLNGSGGTGKSTVQALAITSLALCERECRGARTALGIRASTLVICEKNASVYALARKIAELDNEFHLGLEVKWFAAHGEFEFVDRQVAGITKEERVSQLRHCDVILSTCASALRLADVLKRPKYAARLNNVFLDEVTTVRESRLILLLEQILKTCKPELLSLGGDLNQSRPYTSSSTPCNSGISWLERFVQRYLPSSNSGHSPRPPHWFVTLTENYRAQRRGLVAVQRSMGCNVTLPPGVLEGDVNPRFPAVWMWDVAGTDFTPSAGRHQLKERGVDLSLLNATSAINLQEADAVVDLVRVLIRKHHVKPENILIISPYANQLRVIEHALARLLPHESQGVQCNSCLNNSGNEVEVAIVTFARSSRTTSFEPKGYLDPSHLRTALMRPREALFVFGDRKWLADNHKWGAATMLAAIDSEMKHSGISPPDIHIARRNTPSYTPRYTSGKPVAEAPIATVQLVQDTIPEILCASNAPSEKLPSFVPIMPPNTTPPATGQWAAVAAKPALPAHKPTANQLQTTQRGPVAGGVIYKTAKARKSAKEEAQSESLQPFARLADIKLRAPSVEL